MSEQQLTDVSSMNDGGESSETLVEVNIKTLDSQVFSFQVDKNMLVSEFKEKIASKVGLPVAQQRLIYRGRVLKDNHALSEYHVDSGHTLHLVARQPIESQPPSGTSSGDTGSNNGQDPNATGLPTRIGQISHSVVLGTLNVGDQGEGIVPDVSRVIGAVLNSIGLGSQYTTSANGEANVMGGPQPALQFSSPIQVSQGNQMEGAPSNTGTQSQAGTRAQSGQAFQSPPLPQVLQIPVGAAVQIPVGASIPIPSLDMPIPDSLRTLSEFMSRMELTLLQNGSQPNESQTNTGDQPALDLPANAPGFPTPEALISVLRQAQRLLGDRTGALLSHIAERLEREGSSADISVRGQIQRETMQLGVAMQHLGALLLELGRTMLTLRMGQSPAEAYVNAGPAIYISSSRPNPIMVQPLPLQTSSLFGGSAAPPNSWNLGPVGIGAAPRNVNIHIHTAVGPRAAANADGPQGGHNRSGSGDSGQTRMRHPRNVNAAVVPPRPLVTVPCASQTGVPVSQTLPGSDQISSVVGEINSQLRNISDNIQTGNQASSDGQTESSAFQDPSSRSGSGYDDTNNQLGDLAEAELNSSLMGNKSDADEQKGSLECSQSNNHENSLVDSKGGPPSSSDGGCNDLQSEEPARNLVSESECALVPGPGSDNSERVTAVPLGLGLGGLQPKRKSRQPKIQGKANDGATSNASDQNQQLATDGQQIIQSLASMTNQRNASNFPPSGQLPAGLGHMTGGGQMGGQGVDGQIDVASAMTEVLHSPAFSGLLSGVSQQAGVGSPNVLRNMLEQLTRSPAMMNTVNQIAQQFDGQDVGNMFSGMGRSQGGGLDLASMVQQMMPIVSQALGGPTPLQQPLSSVLPNLQPQSNVESSSRDEKSSDQDSQINLQPVLQRIENQDRPEEIFRSLVEIVARNDDGSDDLVNELSSEEGGLASEFMELLQCDLGERLQGEKGP